VLRRALLAAAAASLASATSAAFAGSSGPGPAPCRTGSLAGAFSLVPGSAGAGNVVYALRLRNVSRTRCLVSGLVGLRLLDAHGRALPTRVRPARPGTSTAVRVVLAPGASASASARFSPDVPGPGEQTAGPCEPRAFRARVTVPAAGPALSVRVAPPTAVCEHGGMQVSVLVAGRRPPGA
jgi:hypothetical protein